MERNPKSGIHQNEWGSGEAMHELNSLIDLKRRLENEPAIKIELAAQLIGVSERTVRRQLHKLEFRRSHNHIWITLRSIATYIEEQYQPSRHYDARKS
jgi:hypothetical protein